MPVDGEDERNSASVCSCNCSMRLNLMAIMSMLMAIEPISFSRCTTSLSSAPMPAKATNDTNPHAIFNISFKVIASITRFEFTDCQTISHKYCFLFRCGAAHSLRKLLLQRCTAQYLRQQLRFWRRQHSSMLPRSPISPPPLRSSIWISLRRPTISMQPSSAQTATCFINSWTASFWGRIRASTCALAMPKAFSTPNSMPATTWAA